MKKLDLAYIAGLFDGEGSLTIFSFLRNGRKFHTLSISIANQDKQVISWVRDLFGGSVHDCMSAASKKGTGNPCWMWTTGSQVAKRFLLAVGPYTKIKKARVELAIQFQNTKSRGRRSQLIPASLIEKRDWYQSEIRRLNRTVGL